MKARATASMAAAAAMTLAPGCVQRRIEITSEPPGGLVHLNSVEIGRTPVEAGFKFYGVYDVRLELEGYEPIWTGRKATAPLWEWPGVDLAALALPANFENVERWHFELSPEPSAGGQPEMVASEVIGRAIEAADFIDPQPGAEIGP